MLPYWKESPCVRILLPLMAGILLFLFYPSNKPIIPATGTIIMAFALLGYNYSHGFFKLRHAFIHGILINIFLIFLSYLICVLHQASASKFWYKHQSANYSYAVAKINTEPEQKEKTWKAEVEILKLCDSGNCINTFGDAIVYFQKNERVRQIKQGDYVLIKNKLKDISRNGNPGSFDYAQYCSLKNIYQSAYLKEHEWVKTDRHAEDFRSFFAQINHNTRNILKNHIPDTAAHGVAEALLLGYRTDIDDDTWQAYTNTGIVHIIAISGMHMAMVYGSTRWLLLLLPFFRKRKKIALLISILLMWTFACITGLPASVTRAAIMFTFIGWGEMQEQKTNMINSLAASALCMLCYNPMLLMDVGFQLSYVAVLSLILFYKPVYELIYAANKVADAVWKLIAMTLAAQILTLPLCIYYFHQFPLLFLFTNLFAVPLTTVILYTEIILVLLQSITPLAAMLGIVISELVLFVNTTVLHLSRFSFAVWSEINISLLQMILMFVIIMYLYLWVFHKKVQQLIFALTAILVFCLTLVYRQFHIFQQNKMVVYNISGQKCIEFISQNKYFNPDRDSVLRQTKNETYALKPAHTFFSVSRSQKSLASSETNGGMELFSFKGKKIMRLENTYFQTEKKINIDVLILSKKCEIDSTWLAQNLKPDIIILDSSIPFWKIEQLKNNLITTSIPVHIVAEQGAFILKI